jgi:oxalate decarboxylase
MQAWAGRRAMMSSATLALGVASIARSATGSDADVSNPGPDKPTLLGQFASSNNPPHTDHGDVPNLWFPFSQAHRRVQPGGWSRQVTVEDFPIAKSIASVNMRLTAGGYRELHWHLPAEWAFMLTGRAQITAVDQNGRACVADVGLGNLWNFPSGLPHSIQGMEPDGCECLLAFDDGKFSEFDTFSISDWVAHTPKEVLAKNWGLDQSVFVNIPKKDLYIFQGTVSLAKPRQSDEPGTVPQPFNFSLASKEPDFQTASGSVRIADSHNFPIASTLAAALVDVKRGGMRELHWHPNSDEWQYWIAGQARMTVFSAGGRARTFDFRARDVGYVPRAMGHYVEHTGNAPMRYLEPFNRAYYTDVSLTRWMAHTPHHIVAQRLKIDQAVLDRPGIQKQPVVPA